MTGFADPPRDVVLDAGPLIALVYEEDADHTVAVAGFGQLELAGTLLTIPLVILVEVHKWLLFHTSARLARRSVAYLTEVLAIRYPGPDDLTVVLTLVDSMPRWSGSLEDAFVAMTGLQLDAPVWTLNYRELAAFRNLRFWTPAA